MDESKLPRAATKPSDLPSPPAFVPLRLVLQPSGPTVELGRPDMLIGRHSDADVRLPLPDVSRRHCRFVFKEGSWEVVDLNSLNGLYVNGERVQRTVLHHRDVVGIGGFRLEVDLGEASGILPLPAADPDQRDDILRSIADALPWSPEASGKKRRAS
jgi:pSer/pThr/pTyr-binding forkhead associated (FHA) protein